MQPTIQIQRNKSCVKLLFSYETLENCSKFKVKQQNCYFRNFKPFSRTEYLFDLLGVGVEDVDWGHRLPEWCPLLLPVRTKSAAAPGTLEVLVNNGLYEVPLLDLKITIIYELGMQENNTPLRKWWHNKLIK